MSGGNDGSKDTDETEWEQIWGPESDAPGAPGAPTWGSRGRDAEGVS